MKQFKYMAIALIATLLLIASCASDEEKPDNVVEGKMTSNIDGKDKDFTVTAISYTGTQDNKKYEYIVISGLDGDMNSSGSNTVVLTVYSEKVEKKTYVVPAMENANEYDFFKGYATGTYFTASDTVTYISYYTKNSQGTVTLDELTENSVKGSYDMVLTSSKDNTKTIRMKGNFHAKIILFINTDIDGKK